MSRILCQSMDCAGSAQNFARVLRAVEGMLERLEVQWHEAHINHIDPARLTCLRHHSTLPNTKANTPTASLIPSYLPAYLARLRASNLRVERVGIVLYLAEGRGLVQPVACGLVTRVRSFFGHNGRTEERVMMEKRKRKTATPLLPALDAALTSFPALHVGLEWTAARFGLDSGCSSGLTADAEWTTGEHKEAWAAELCARNLDKLWEER
ncbi:hypothetical protein B0H14DRAFT_3528055 [Mycena olivaceomarginata]|nr:hypothetical protein B0H14DRAFT_3528055 [Mycena olivaceomarginata]